MGGAGGERKPFIELGGRCVLLHAAAAFEAAAGVDELIVVAREEDVERVRELAGAAPELTKLRAVVPGGADRCASVRAGVRATGEEVELVAVHDAARPLVEPATIEAALAVAAERGAALVALPVGDTIKESTDGEAAERTLDRSRLWAAQTPQVFRRTLLLELLERAEREGFSPTDDAALHERYVGPVPLVRGTPGNLKLTTPEDLALARALLAARAARP